MQTLIVLFITAVFTMFTSFSKSNKTTKYVAIFGLLLGLLINVFGLNFNILQFANFYEMQKTSLLMSNLSIIITFLIFINSQRFDKNYAWNEFYTLALFSLCGAHILFGFTHLLTMFLGIEILSIPLYVLAASNKENKYSLEAGLKYFILGSFSSALMLFALALIYGAIGSLSVYDIVQNQLIFQSQTQPFFLIGVALIVIAVLFKFAVVPFHFWTPDVYTGSPTIVTSFMATVVKIAIANVLIFLFIGYFAIQNVLWIKLFTVAIILSLVISNVIALYQKNVKRLMAYSSISHSAFLLMALIVSYYAQNQLVVLYYLVSYVLVSVFIFMIISQFSGDSNKSSLAIFDGMYKKSPFFAISLTFFILSLAGIPFTAGFMAKFQVLYGIYSINKLLFILGLLASAISVVYYLKIINRIYFYQPSNIEFKNNWILKIATILVIIYSFILAIFPTESILWLENYIQVLKLSQNA